MQCSFCPASIPDGAKFCPECGKQQPVIVPKEEAKAIPPILKIDEAAELLRISRSYLYRLLARPDDPVPWFPLGKSKRFITEELLAWARRNQQNMIKAG